MLTVPFIRTNTELTIAGLEKKRFANAAEVVKQILELDEVRKNLLQQAEHALEKSNAIAREIGGLMKSGQIQEADSKKAETAELKIQIKSLGDAAKKAEQDVLDVLVTLPNLPHSLVPEGKSADDNEIVQTWGAAPTFAFEPLPHWDLIKKYDIIDFDLGNKITGAGFPVYKGKGARLQRALINFFLDEAIQAGYYEIQPPILINEDSGFGTGQLPDKEGQMYITKEEGLYLIPTAEVPITNLYRDIILNEKDLPIKNVGHTPCFRREAGSWGAHVRGLNRLHQFDKIEIVQIRKPEESYQALEEMSIYVQGLLQKLGLHYRVLRLCGGDMGFASALTYDMEAWSGAQNRWLEVSSVSNFETFQANRLKLRMKIDGKSVLCHTLNGSALALPRIVASILENNQTENGIKIPEVLIPYCGFSVID
ncbi:MAG: Serine--tRNA ligase [Bacteroidota bacterium]|jgi:seryl-tRNA synthetase